MYVVRSRGGRKRKKAKGERGGLARITCRRISETADEHCNFILDLDRDRMAYCAISL